MNKTPRSLREWARTVLVVALLGNVSGAWLLPSYHHTPDGADGSAVASTVTAGDAVVDAVPAPAGEHRDGGCPICEALRTVGSPAPTPAAPQAGATVGLGTSPPAALAGGTSLPPRTARAPPRA